jgi:hypothetical protein
VITSIVLFNIVMVALGAATGSGIMPTSLIGAVLDWTHNTVGITSPPPEKARMVALIWIGSTIVIVDGTLLMLVFFTRQLM